MILKGRRDEAWAIVAKLHYNPADPEEVYARKEFYQMCRQVDNDRQYFEHETIWDLFRKPSYRKRMICGFFTFFSNESSGILVIYSKDTLPAALLNIWTKKRNRLQRLDLPGSGTDWAHASPLVRGLRDPGRARKWDQCHLGRPGGEKGSLHHGTEWHARFSDY